MSTLDLDVEPTATKVAVTDEKLVIDLTDGRVLMVPLDWYPRLWHATQRERQNWRLLGDGYAVEWPDIDEHIGMEGLVAGRRSGESQATLSRWLEQRSNVK